jgi:hypothetical protein
MMNDYFSLSLGSITNLRKTFQKKAALLLFFVMFSVLGVNAQVTTNSGSGLAATYSSLAEAITALNAATITSPVTITLSGNETSPAGGYNITATGTSTNTITIEGSSSTITAPTTHTAGSLVDAIFKITGGDWITIQNFTMLENASNTVTTAASNTMTEFGVALFYATTTNGAQNCTIQNNVITLNRTYQNTFGIYSNSTHTNANITSASATSLAGGNSGLKVYGNAISNVNLGIVVVGPTAAADANTGIDIGGSASGTGNTISNFGTTGTFTTYPNVSGTVNGILVRNSNGFNVSYNSITSSNGGITLASTLRGIYIPSASIAPTGTFTNSINNNTIALTHGFSSGTIQGITVESTTGNATSTQNINNNNFTSLKSSVTTSGTITAISNVMPNLVNNFNGNTFTNIVTNTTGSFTFFGHGYTMPAGGSQTINGNSIVTAFSKTGAGGTVTISTSATSSPNGTFHTFTNNNFSNITVTGATGITGVTNTDGSSSSATRTVTGNTFNNWTGGTSSITGMSYGYIGGTTSTISNNTITNITGQGAITGITIGSSASLATTLNVSNNTITNLSSTGTGGAVTGLSCSNASTTININGNAINTLSSTGASAVTALSIGGGATTNVYQNKIYNLLGTNASSTVNGLLISAGTNINTFNNIIGDLRATAASGTDVIRGISITASTATSNQRVYNNTIYLSASSTGTNFGSTGIFHTYSATATTAALDMRNNIVVNASTANGTGLAVAFRRSSATDLNNYATTSNNNMFFGTSGIFFNGTTNYNSAAFQTLVSTRETASKFQNPLFASTTGSASTFLHFADLAVNLAGGNGQVIAGYTTDFDGDTRDASTPDIGADEWNNGVITAPSISSFSPLVLCIEGGQTVTLTGAGFDTATEVKFNGASGQDTLSGTITAATATSMTVTTPVGVVDGYITVVNPAGQVTSTATYTTASAPTIGVTAGASICSGTSTSLTATGGATYSWSPALGLNGTTTETVVASPTVNTTYTVTGFNVYGCKSTATSTVTVLPVPSAVTVSKNPTSICVGGITTLTAAGGTVPTPVSTYGFAGSTDTYTAITGTTLSSSAIGDDVGVGNLPIGFTFPYNGSTQTVFAASSNGLLLLGNTSATISGASANALASTANAIAPLWDDNNTTGGSIIYSTTGTAPNRVLTVQWTGIHIAGGGSSTTPTINMQVKLYENGTIQFIYGAQSAALSSPTCSIGISGASGNYLSVSPLSPINTSTVSTSTENTSVVTANIPSGTVLTFTKPADPVLVWSPSTDLYTDAAATVAYSGGTNTVVYAKNLTEQTYTATATLGTCSISGSATVTPNALPTITSSGDVSICNGGSGATLTAAGGSTYAWAPTTGLSSGTGETVTANPSATTTYTITGTDANGCVNTTTAVVTVNNPVAITGQPANVVALEATSANFTVAATGTGLSYQWEESADNGATWTSVSGATSATYSFTTAASQTGYQYRCVVSGTAPCTPVTSSAATLTISNVSFLTQPANQIVCSSGIASYTATTEGAVTSYQWQYSTNGTEWFDVLGQTTNTLELSGLTSSNTGQTFRLVLNGSVNSNPATLTVYDAVAFTTQPASVAVCSGVNASFSAVATGSGLSYQWQVNNGTSWENISGATTASYTVAAPTGAMNGYQYRLVASGTAPCAPLMSDAVTLTVTDVTVAASSASICIGGATTLNATFVGSPDYTNATWTSTTGSGAETAVSGASVSVTPTAAGSYTYTFVSDGTCPLTKTVAVTVNALPIISSVTATPATVCSGANISLGAASIANANGTAALGAGALTSSSTANSIFPGSWGGTKSQYLMKASELTALGLAAGNITSIAFEPTTSGQTYQGFFVSIASTTNSVLTTTFLPNGTQVYAGTLTDNGFTPVANTVNTLAFGTGSGSSSSFEWDGTSNIVVTFSWSRVPSATTATGSTMKYDSSVGYVCATYKQADSQTPAAMLSQASGTTSSNRPKFTFGGVVATNFASTYTWSWNSTPAVSAVSGTTTITNTSGADVTNTFTATATNAAGCTNSATTSAVTVHYEVPAPTATDSAQCGSQTPTCSVTGTGNVGNTFRWYTVATAGTAIAGQTASTLSSYPVGTTTTFYVSEATPDGLCESARTPVTVTVTQPYEFTLSSNAVTNCSGVPSTTAVTIATNGGYTSYSWTNNATVSGDSSTGWYFSPTTTTTYTVTATDGVCSTTASVTSTPIALPVLTASAVPAAVCVGGSSTITALTNEVSPGTAKVGTSTTTNTSSTGYPTAFGDYWYQDWQQYVYTAAELNALGMTAGNITSLTFDVSGLPSADVSDYNVKIGATSNATLTGFTTTGLTNVFGPEPYTATVGANTITFTTPYLWDGTSNIIVDIRGTGSYGSANATINYTTTTGNTVVYAYSSSNNASFWTSAPTATTSTSRPNITFAGQKVTQVVGSLAYSWNDASSTTGNVLTVTPSETTTYTVYGLNSTTGCIGSATATVTIYTPPTAPAVTNGSICGAGIPTTATVADTNGYTTPTFKWYVDDVTTTALQSSTSPSFTSSVSATTTYYVSVLSPGGCESGRTPITITVFTPATLSVSPAVTVCAGSSATLTASGAESYTWSPALGLDGTSSASVVATPTASTTYSVTGVDANGCTTAAATVSVTVAPYPSTVTVSQGAGSLCANSIMSLTASGGTVGGSGTSTLGAGASTSTSAGANPFYGGYGGVKTQFLIRASELTALGMSAGNINSLQLDLTTAGSTLNGLGISVGSTSLTDLTSNIETGLSSVYTNASFVPVVGANTFDFSTPYSWDGTSNIIVSFCWSNANTSNTASTVSVDSPGFTSSNARYVDSVVAADVCSYSGNTTPAGWNGSSLTGSTRPKMVFAYSTVQSSPVTWSPTTDLYTDAAATTPYTGGAAAVVYTKPTSEITYTATASNGACTTSATSTVSPYPVPTFSVDGATICNGQSTTLTASAPGYTYSWSPATGLSEVTGTSVIANPTVTTTYTVVATDAVTGCTSSQTVTVTVNQPGAILTLGTTTAQVVVPGQDATFTVATQSGVAYVYQWQVNAGSGWSNITDDTNYSGTSTDTLTATKIDPSLCVFDSSCGYINGK